jgi:TetR/AcrR family transcriptional regulator, transcriptional repressor for nem operon
MRQPEITKELLLQKAGQLFNTKGYKATSISEITDATGLTKGAIYKHFGSKKQLEEEALMHLSKAMFDHLRQCIKAAHTAGEKLRAIFSFFEQYLIKPPIKGGCPLLNVAIEADDAHPDLRKKAMGMLQLLKEAVHTLLDNGIRYKQLKPGIDKEYYATIIIASLEGAIMMSKLSRSSVDIKMITRHLAGLVKEMEL